MSAVMTDELRATQHIIERLLEDVTRLITTHGRAQRHADVRHLLNERERIDSAFRAACILQPDNLNERFATIADELSQLLHGDAQPTPIVQSAVNPPSPFPLHENRTATEAVALVPKRRGRPPRPKDTALAVVTPRQPKVIVAAEPVVTITPATVSMPATVEHRKTGSFQREKLWGSINTITAHDLSRYPILWREVA